MNIIKKCFYSSCDFVDYYFERAGELIAKGCSGRTEEETFTPSQPIHIPLLASCEPGGPETSEWAEGAFQYIGKEIGGNTKWDGVSTCWDGIARIILEYAGDPYYPSDGKKILNIFREFTNRVKRNESARFTLAFLEQKTILVIAFQHFEKERRNERRVDLHDGSVTHEKRVMCTFSDMPSIDESRERPKNNLSGGGYTQYCRYSFLPSQSYIDVAEFRLFYSYPQSLPESKRPLQKIMFLSYELDKIARARIDWIAAVQEWKGRLFLTSVLIIAAVAYLVFSCLLKKPFNKI